MPLTWPTKGPTVGLSAKATIGHSLDVMAESPKFIELVSCLLSDPFWLKEFKVGAFKAAVILSKMILHHVYDLSSGNIMKRTISDALQHENIEHKDFDYYAGSRINQDGAMSINAWQALAVLYAAEPAAEPELELTEPIAEPTAEPASEEPMAVIAEPIEFFDTTAYHEDAFALLLRGAMTMTGYIQKLHIQFMKQVDSVVPKGFLGFERTNAKRQIDIWRNYFFDIGAMWIIARRFHESLTPLADSKPSSNAIARALGKARMWSYTTGLAGSIQSLKSLVKVPPELLQAALALHWMYIRLWNHMSVISAHKYSSSTAHLKAISRISSKVYIKSDTDIKNDVPEIGSGPLGPTLLEPVYSNLKPEQLGLAWNSASLAEPGDIKYSFYVGFLSVAITQSTAYLWAAVRHYEAWENNLDEGLPKESMVQKWSEAPWALSIDELKSMSHDFRKKYTQAEEQREKEEIDNIMKTL